MKNNLLVDDVIDILGIQSLSLQVGYDVLVAHDSQEGLGNFEKNLSIIHRYHDALIWTVMILSAVNYIAFSTTAKKRNRIRFMD